MTVRRLVAAAALLVLPLSVIVVAGPAGATPTPARLGDVSVTTTGANTASCGAFTGPCRTISYALGRVDPGGTIHVGAGTFAEQLVISFPVSITGAGAATVIAPSTLAVTDTDTDSSYAEDAIVDVTPGTTGVSLSDLTINGAAASSSFTGCADDFVGVYFHSASGSLSNLAVENIALPTALFGCQDGQGIYVDAAPGATANVDIDRVSVTGYDKNGITCDDKGVNCDISNSVVTGVGPTPLIAQNGIQIWCATSAQLDNDTVSQNSYTDPLFDSSGYYTEATGVLVINAGSFTLSRSTVTANDDNVYVLADPNPTDGNVLPSGAPKAAPWSITDNDLSGAVNNSDVPTGAGIGDSLDIDSTTAPVEVANNSADDSPEFGIFVLGSTNVVVDQNEANDDGVGFFVAGPGTAGHDPTADTFFDNVAVGSGLFGFFLYPDATGLLFLANTAQQSGVTDVSDSSTGSGTAGTANLWIDTACTTSSPTGICTANRIGHGHFPIIGFPTHRGGIGARGFSRNNF